jgi:hypothetical protein
MSENLKISWKSDRMGDDEMGLGTIIKVFAVIAIIFGAGLLAGAYIVEQDNANCAPVLNHCMGSLNLCVGTLENCSGYLQSCADILEASQ